MIFSNNNILLSKDPLDNLIFNGDDCYKIDFLKQEGKYVHGGNGFIFKLVNEQEPAEYVIKIIKYPEQYREENWIADKRIKRFEREIEAMSVAKENSLDNVVEFHFSGTLNIGGLDFQYYVMQKCDCTLDDYLSNPENKLNIYQKTLLCEKILTGIMGLHEYKIYHRDIKYDNILFIGNEPFICDLGLADYRNSDIRINERGELIGPTGWFSPEAINKHLIEKHPNPYRFDFLINEKSEVFQLGKLFWYIFQGNLPIGQIVLDDFIVGDTYLFNMIFNMLLYSKNRRYDTRKVKFEINRYLENN